MNIADLSVPGKWLIITLVLVAVMVIAIILFMRSYLKKESDQLPGKDPNTRRVKYPEVDVFNMSGTFFTAALMSALLLTILAFNWTTYEEEIYIPEGAGDFDEEIEVETPRTKEPPPPPPPPPPPVIEEVNALINHGYKDIAKKHRVIKNLTRCLRKWETKIIKNKSTTTV